MAFVSERVGNYQFHPLYYGLLEQVWVKSAGDIDVGLVVH